jgi:hypothetical protein
VTGTGEALNRRFLNRVLAYIGRSFDPTEIWPQETPFEIEIRAIESTAKLRTGERLAAIEAEMARELGFNSRRQIQIERQLCEGLDQFSWQIIDALRGRMGPHTDLKVSDFIRSQDAIQAYTSYCKAEYARRLAKYKYAKRPIDDAALLATSGRYVARIQSIQEAFNQEHAPLHGIQRWVRDLVAAIVVAILIALILMVFGL